MDRYDEYVVKAGIQGKGLLGFIGGILLILAGLFVMLTIFGGGAFVIVGGVLLCTFFKDFANVEYEYIFTNGDIDIAKVIGKSRRKEIFSVGADSIAKMAKVDSDKVKNDMSLGKMKIKKFLGKEEQNPIAFYVGEGDDQYMLLLDLNDKCIDHMKSVLKVKSEIK